MKNETHQNNRSEYIRLESERYAAANTYSLSNSLLTENEKTEVELWYQFPLSVMFISLCIMMICSIYYPIAKIYIFGVPMAIDFSVGLINWLFHIKIINKIFFLSIGHNVIQFVLAVITSITLIWHGYIFYSVLIIILKFGLIALISPSFYTYTLLAKKYNTHIKWAYFKRFYDYEFPFDKETKRKLG